LLADTTCITLLGPVAGGCGDERSSVRALSIVSLDCDGSERPSKITRKYGFIMTVTGHLGRCPSSSI
ncbi:hypothetical protein, partial [Paraburkholderia sp. J11-2]|uniref:hypothetical protein n=1 Tax=Paraburkholderia sp. J11-2 TaxID=2805431 RepID=UPI002AB69F13